MAEIVKIKKDGVIQYPITKPECVIDENGKNVLQLIKENGGGSSYDDTEVKNELARLEREKADKSELTELSAEVSGLSEKIENLPSGESSVFEAVYGETTYDAIVAAFNAKKHVLCIWNDRVYNLSAVTSTLLNFSCTKDSVIYSASCKNDNVWGNLQYNVEHVRNKATSLTSASTDAQYPSAKAVYDFVQNAGTPSGDPMHYMFEAVGAEYNDTGADIERQGIYGDTITWKAGYWWLNELGDITNEEMRVIYAERYPITSAKYIPEWFREAKARTTLSAFSQDVAIVGNYLANRANCETFKISTLGVIKTSNFADGLYKCPNLKKILDVIDFNSLNQYSAGFGACEKLQYLMIKNLKFDISFQYNFNIDKSSYVYMIENSAATTPIIIRVPSTQYDSLLADTDIQAALTAHPNVSLAK